MLRGGNQSQDDPGLHGARFPADDGAYAHVTEVFMQGEIGKVDREESNLPYFGLNKGTQVQAEIMEPYCKYTYFFV